MIEDYVGKVINGDCIEVMAKMPESSVDLIVTSPPYGVGIAYDSFNDDIEFEQYKLFSASWLREAYRVLKDDGRIAMNIHYEINRQDKGGRILMVSELWQLVGQERVKVMVIPDIESVNFGRGVGYDIIEHIPPQEVSEISATKIREQLKQEGKL